MVGIAQLRTSVPPGASDVLVSLGDTFEVRKRPIARFGCDVFTGVFDLESDELFCGTSDYRGESGESLWANFNILPAFPCPSHASGPIPTGQCLQSFEYLVDGAYSYEKWLAAYPTEMTMSLQRDGSIYWTAAVGNVVYADAILVKAAEMRD